EEIEAAIGSAPGPFYGRVRIIGPAFAKPGGRGGGIIHGREGGGAPFTELGQERIGIRGPANDAAKPRLIRLVAIGMETGALEQDGGLLEPACPDLSDSPSAQPRQKRDHRPPW